MLLHTREGHLPAQSRSELVQRLSEKGKGLFYITDSTPLQMFCAEHGDARVLSHTRPRVCYHTGQQQHEEREGEEAVRTQPS